MLTVVHTKANIKYTGRTYVGTQLDRSSPRFKGEKSLVTPLGLGVAFVELVMVCRHVIHECPLDIAS